MPFVLILIYVYALTSAVDIHPLAYSQSSDWYTCITYSFVHFSFFHLLINSFVFITYWRSFEGVLRRSFTVPLMMAVPIVSALISGCIYPTAGASAIVYAMTGIYVVCFPLSRGLMIRFLSVIVFSFLITFLFAHQVNTSIHVISFLLSVLIAYPLRRFSYVSGNGHSK